VSLLTIAYRQAFALKFELYRNFAADAMLIGQTRISDGFDNP
jgi:hypothetical protein